jgi:hypothetical protein
LRALRAQLLILAMLCLLGVITWLIDYQRDLGGDWFTRFGFTRFIWMGIGLYALVSSILVFLVWILCRLESWPYTALGVALTHAIGVGLVALGLSLGIHDRIDDALRHDRRLGPGDAMRLEQPPQRPRPPIPAPSPSLASKPLPRAPSDSPAHVTSEDARAEP